MHMAFLCRQHQQRAAAYMINAYSRYPAGSLLVRSIHDDVMLNTMTLITMTLTTLCIYLFSSRTL